MSKHRTWQKNFYATKVFLSYNKKPFGLILKTNLRQNGFLYNNKRFREQYLKKWQGYFKEEKFKPNEIKKPKAFR